MNTEREKKADMPDPNMDEISRLSLNDARIEICGRLIKDASRLGLSRLGVEIVTAQQIYEEMIKVRDDG